MPEKEMQVENQIQDELEIDETTLSEETTRQPSKFFYWATSWALAAKKARSQKLKTKEVEARLGKEYREQVKGEDPKIRVTEKMIDEFLYEHPEYKLAVEEEIKAEYMEDMLGVAKDAFKQRSQALIELIRHDNEARFLGDEYKVMKNELEARTTEQLKKRKTKKEEISQ